MSSYGTAFVVDVPEAGREQAETLLAGGVDGVTAASLGGVTRLSGYDPDFEAVGELVESVVAAVAGARAVLAEDFDEYGAQFRVLVGEGGSSRTIYQAYVLNADPDEAEEVEAALGDLEGDPRAADVTGPDATAAVAQTFGVDPSAMVAADQGYRSTAWEEIGEIGGPFPWWDALELEWPTG